MTPFPASHPRFRQELAATLRLAAPIALAQIAQIGMGVTDTVLLGGVGRDALAAGGLGAGMFFALGGTLQGMLSAVGILIAHARGAGARGTIAPVLHTGLALALGVALPLMAVLWNAASVLHAIGEAPALGDMVARYLRILMWATPALMMMGAQRAYVAAMGRAGLLFGTTAVALVANGLLNYGLIHGAFGLPRLGYLGSATATGLTLWGQSAAVGVGMRLIAALRAPRGDRTLDAAILRELIHLGWPIGVTVGVEMVLFMSAGLMMGLVSTAALAAHQISLNVGALVFMIPLGIAQAANVRVGYHSGAGAPRAARRAGFVALLLGVAYAAVSASVIMLARPVIPLLYGLSAARDADVAAIAMAGRLLTIAAAFQLFDATQTIANGALRGLKDTRVPMLLALASYWLCGFPVAWLLGFPARLGAAGIWWGLALGLAVAAALLTTRFWVLSQRYCRTGSIEDAARQAFGPVLVEPI